MIPEIRWILVLLALIVMELIRLIGHDKMIGIVVVLLIPGALDANRCIVIPIRRCLNKVFIVLMMLSMSRIERICY